MEKTNETPTKAEVVDALVGLEGQCKILNQKVGGIDDSLTIELDVTLKPNCVLLVGVTHGVFIPYLGGSTFMTTTNYLLGGNNFIYEYISTSSEYLYAVEMQFTVNSNNKLVLTRSRAEYDTKATGNGPATNIFITNVVQIPCTMI